MKTFAITLLISAFLVLSNAYPCSEAYEFADMSINSLRNNFVNDLYANMFEDFENVMKSAELIKDSCPESVNFVIDNSKLHTCSLAYIALSKILEDYGFQRDAETVNTLSQIMSLIPVIDEKYCLDDWEMITLENMDNFDDGIWADYDSTHDYDYDKSDDYNPHFIEDEEEEKTGDEVYPYSDDDSEEIKEIEPAQIWPGTEMQEDGSDIQTGYDEEREDEDDDLEYYDDDESDENDNTAQEIDEQEDTIMVFVDPSKELNLLAEVGEDITIENTPAVSKEAEEIIMVFVAMTNMENTDLLHGEEEESLSIYANASIGNGELSFEAENEDSSLFVYVDLNNVLGVDEVVNAIFAENQDDEEVEAGEIDLKQYWDDDGDDY